MAEFVRHNVLSWVSQLVSLIPRSMSSEAQARQFTQLVFSLMLRVDMKKKMAMCS
ncbi:MAG: hypothetical protein GY903_32510 [Fuerstiella sp.]|nr:hypothetical protein [Fuerstiella sp.]MCP4859215.1 hypothetical protein [Fuerstiella sp.]